jgi:phage gpG-like protein
MIEIEDDKTKQELLGAIREITLELSKMDESRDVIKEIISATADAFDLPKPLIRKVAKLYHKKTAAQFETEAEEIKSVYKQITLV